MGQIREGLNVNFYDGIALFLIGLAKVNWAFIIHRRIVHWKEPR